MRKSLLVVSALLIATAARAGDFKAAYVDIQRAVQEVDEGKAARARLQGIVEQKQKALQAEQEGLKKEKDDFEKQAATMTEEVKRQKGEALQKKLYEFGQRFEVGRTELAGIERKELAGMFPKMEVLIGQMAQREGFTMVFDKSSSGLAWAPPALDLTNELIRTYNATYKMVSKADAPKVEAKKPEVKK